MTRNFDVVIFGATGVTGRYAVEQIFRSAKEEGLSWAVAGRSEGRLVEALKEVAPWIKEDPDSFSRSTPKIIADVSDPNSLREMARKCRIVVNTVGPYRFYGEAVVSACVEESTHHVDVSGEPQYIETMQLKYHEKAKEKKIYLVSACGFDSIPCESLFSFTKESFRGRLNSIETFLSFDSPKGGHTNTGTWNSAIHGVANWHELPPLRKKISETLFQKKMEKPTFKLGSRGVVSTSPLVQGYCLPFLGSDKSIVVKSEMFRNEVTDNYHPVQIGTYFRVPSIIGVIGVAIIGMIFGLFTRFTLGQKLLSRYPAFFSLGMFREGAPSREQLQARTMRTVAQGKGWQSGDDETKPPTKEIVCAVDGPDPAYIGTSIMLVHSAICILKDNLAMPLGGGCLSPGFAFEKTSLRKRLEDRGFKYTVVSQS